MMEVNMRDMYFDLKRPIGPMRVTDTCEFGLKQVRFSTLASTTDVEPIRVELCHGMQCSTLEYGEVKHILTFELSGMRENEQGCFTGAAIVINKHNVEGTNDMFARSLLTTIDCDIEHEVWLDSRFHSAWEKAIVSVVLDPLHGHIVVYTEPADLSSKRTREGVTNIMRTPKVRLPDGSTGDSSPTPTASSWVDLGGGLKKRVYDALWLKEGGSAPHIGVRLDPILGCLAKIVHPREKVIEQENLEDIEIIAYA